MICFCYAEGTGPESEIVGADAEVMVVRVVIGQEKPMFWPEEDVEEWLEKEIWKVEQYTGIKVGECFKVRQYNHLRGFRLENEVRANTVEKYHLFHQESVEVLRIWWKQNSPGGAGWPVMCKSSLQLVRKCWETWQWENDRKELEEAVASQNYLVDALRA